VLQQDSYDTRNYHEQTQAGGFASVLWPMCSQTRDWAKLDRLGRDADGS
jgi:hypothetical protein